MNKQSKEILANANVKIEGNWRKSASTLILPQHKYLLKENKGGWVALSGGRGSGKTTSIAVTKIFRMMFEKDFNWIMLREVGERIYESQFKSLKIASQNIHFGKTRAFDFFNFSKSDLEVKCLLNGNSIKGYGFDTDFKSIEKRNGVWISEELFEDYDLFLDMYFTLRDKNKKVEIESDFNNSFKNYQTNWYYQKYFSKNIKGNDYNFEYIEKLENPTNTGDTEDFVFKSIHNFPDTNKFLSTLFIKKLWTESNNGGQYYLEKNWFGFFTNKIREGLIYFEFKRELHFSKPPEFDANKILWFSIDFNVNPYCACVVAQVYWDDVEQKDVVYIIDLIKEKSVVDTMRVFFARYKNAVNIHYTGDVTIIKENVEQTEHSFQIIRKILGIYGHPHLDTSNPSVAVRVQFVNYLLNQKRIFFNKKFEEISFEFSGIIHSPKGDKLKEKGKEGYEIYGHISDAVDYLVVQVFKKDYLNFIRGNVGGLTVLNSNPKLRD